jgi:hypothetical protein
MSNVSAYWDQGELSLAAYANLTKGMVGEAFKVALTGGGQILATDQANLFALTYDVVAVHTDSNGLSATVFGRKDGTGEKCLAIRGTNDLDDLLTDLVDIALLGTTALQSQYTSLKAQVTSWINDGTLASGFTVAGHSLWKIGVRPRFKFDNQKLALPPIFVHAQRLFGIRGAPPIVLSASPIVLI